MKVLLYANCRVEVTPIERRDRALIAFALLSGMRDDAIASLSIKHVDIERRTIFQDARMVRTKFRKTITSDFFPVGDDFEAIVSDWIKEIVEVHCFSPNDPLFPSTKVERGADGLLEAVGLRRDHWKTADSIRRIFKLAFGRCSLPNFHPHSFRHTLANLGGKVARSPEEWKAWSQNFGHAHSRTTFYEYGNVTSERQSKLFCKFRKRSKKGVK